MFIVHVHCSLFMFIVHCSHGATLIFDDLFWTKAPHLDNLNNGVFLCGFNKCLFQFKTLFPKCNVCNEHHKHEAQTG